MGKNIKLATYASRCIDNEILMFLRKNKKRKTEISFEDSLSYDADGNELHLEDVIGTDGDIVTKELEDKNKIINIDKYNDIVEVANSLSYKKLNSMLEYIKEGRVNLMNNGNYSLVISVILMGFLEVWNKW